MLFNETINGASLIQIHDSAYQNVIRAYHKGGSVYVSRDDLMTHLKRSMKKNMSFVPMEEINAEKGYYNAADKETGRVRRQFRRRKRLLKNKYISNRAHDLGLVA